LQHELPSVGFEIVESKIESGTKFRRVFV
jgi:hypothetical protein